MSFLWFGLFFMINAIVATTIPANIKLRAPVSSSAIVTEPASRTFSTILPTYTPVQPVLKQTTDIRILFNNRAELSKADQEKPTNTVFMVSTQTTSSEDLEFNVHDYRF